MIISDFVKCELDKFRTECNFTEEELELLVKCVSKELEKVEAYLIKKNIVDYNISDIMAEQHHKKEKYKCKIKEMAAEKLP